MDTIDGIDEFKHLDIEKVADRGIKEWLRIARLQGQWTASMALKRQAESLGVTGPMMQQFDVHIKSVEDRLPTPANQVVATQEDIK